MEVLEAPLLARHRLSVDDYDRMVETGVLGPEARVELIDGEVIDMAAIGSKHYAAVLRLDHLLKAAVGGQALVAVQSSLRLDGFNQPEPDLVVLKPRADCYAGALPGAADALLVIEVADTTLAYDVRIKAPLYARHGVAELWVVDLAGAMLRRFAGPEGDSWARVGVVDIGESVVLPGLSGTSVDLSGLL